jgi:hypothetical protein
MTDTEEWACVPGHPFMVSSLGKVRNEDRVATFSRDGKMRTCRLRGRLLHPWVAQNGYQHVSHKNGGERRKYLVHRLVCLAFNFGFEVGHSVNHKNGVKTDNRAENLEWCTLAENTAHQWRTGLVNLRGQNHPLAKLTDEQADQIRSSTERVAELAGRFQVSESCIYKIRAGLKRVQMPTPS